MPAPSNFNTRALLYSIPVGVIAVFVFSWLSGHSFDTGPFPILAVLLGFTITGMIIGYTSAGETILEPGLASIAVACITYFLIPAMGMKGYSDFSAEEDLLTMLNGVLFTFCGALVGEKLQGSAADTSGRRQMDWSWVFSGSVVGITITFTLIAILSFFMGYVEWVHFVAFSVGLFVTGYLTGYRSQAKTILEAGIAGLITVILCTDFVFVVLLAFDATYIVLSTGIGVVAALAGGLIGEKMQSRREGKKDG